MDDFIRSIWNGAYKDGSFSIARATKYAQHFAQAILAGYGQNIATIDHDTPDYSMLKALHENVWHFSAAKNRAEIVSLSSAMHDDRGKLRTFAEFRREAVSITGEFQGSWLKTEYDNAVGASTMAARWVEHSSNPNTILTYRTVGDDRVRHSHRILDRISKPINDPFWDIFYPPNGFGCRCDVQRSINNFITPDENIPASAADEVPPMFRTNLAKNGLVFPPDHPYFKDFPPPENFKYGQ